MAETTYIEFLKPYEWDGKRYEVDGERYTPKQLKMTVNEAFTLKANGVVKIVTLKR